jgi:hypothetical protein
MPLHRPTVLLVVRVVAAVLQAPPLWVEPEQQDKDLLVATRCTAAVTTAAAVAVGVLVLD